MRVLVTGADGFVGRHLCKFLEDAGDVVIPIVGSITPPPGAPRGARRIDVRDGAAVHEALADSEPEAIIHLAAVSSIVQSDAEPAITFQVNAVGALNVCLAAKALEPRPRVLLVSSGEVYGPTASGEKAVEGSPFAPISPYASAKIAAEMIGLQFARSYGMWIVRARPFNHLGAGQSPAFSIPSFARQVKAASAASSAASKDAPRTTLFVGDLNPVRDFSHVKDVVAAYRLLLDRGAPGEAYNVCSGRDRTIRSVLDELVDLAGVKVDVRVDPSKLRPVDVPRLVGNGTKLRGLGWEPRFTVRDALRDVLDEPQVG